MLAIASMIILRLAHKQLDATFETVLGATVDGGIVGRMFESIFRRHVVDVTGIV
jgi:hypothetical protein